ncbi:MAG: hypothetical protein ACERKD_00630 [Prolixibacteraceae bacterium]
MKKSTILLAISLLGFTSVGAQPELSVNTGITHYWTKSNPYYVRSIFMGTHSGIEVKIPAKNNNYAVSFGYEQNDGMLNSTFNYWSTNSTNIESPAPDRRIERYRSFALQAYYQPNRLEIFAGYELKLVQIGPSDEQPQFQNYSFRELGISAGLEYRMFKNWGISGKIYIGGIGKPVWEPTHIISRASSALSLKFYLSNLLLNQKKKRR